MSMTKLEREQQTRIEQLEACAKSALRRGDLEPLRKALNHTRFPPSGKAEFCGKCGDGLIDGECPNASVHADALEAKPHDPEDLPHPGTGRLLSASPVKPPEPAKCDCNERFADSTVHMDGCPNDNPPHPPKPAPNIGEQLDRMEQENLRLRAQLAAAQTRAATASARIVELERERAASKEPCDCTPGTLTCGRNDCTRPYAVAFAKAAIKDRETFAQNRIDLALNEQRAAYAKLREERDTAIKAKEEAERDAAYARNQWKIRIDEVIIAQATAESLRAALEWIDARLYRKEFLTGAEREVWVKAREALAAHSKAVGP